MADAGRNQKHLGIDTNVLVAYLDHDHPQHSDVRKLSRRRIALNPTVIHEAYQTLVFKMRWEREEASQTLKDAVSDEDILFIGQSLKTTFAGLDIASQYSLGGRDSLILANFLIGGIQNLRTFDENLLKIAKVKYGRRTISIKRP
jgi:predicted nucleic acid-binding protein